jgi:hypothetical protein
MFYSFLNSSYTILHQLSSAACGLELEALVAPGRSHPGLFLTPAAHSIQDQWATSGVLRGVRICVVTGFRRGHLRRLHPCYSVYTHSLTTTDTGSILPCTVANRSGISPSHNSIRFRSVSKGLTISVKTRSYLTSINSATYLPSFS